MFISRSKGRLNRNCQHSVTFRQPSSFIEAYSNIKRCSANDLNANQQAFFLQFFEDILTVNVSGCWQVLDGCLTCML